MNEGEDNRSKGNQRNDGSAGNEQRAVAGLSKGRGGQQQINKQTNIAGGDKAADVEKTAYEKFEDSVRETIFNVLYVLLKNEEHSKWDTTIEVVADMIQIYSFTFNQSAAYPWRQEDIMYYFEWFFNVFQFDTLYNFVDYTTFLVIFYSGILVVVLVIIDIIYVSYSFQQKKFKYVWPLTLLRKVCSALVTVFFLNFLELFCNFLKCLPSEDDPSVLVMSLYSDVVCWEGIYVLHAGFAVFVSFLFIIICLIAALALYESQESPNDISSKVSSRADFGVLIFKIVILYEYSFLYQRENHWLTISTTFIMSVIIYKGFRDNWPYYSDYMNKLMSLVTGLLVWGNFVLIIVKLLESTEFDGGLQIYFLGLPLVGLLVVYSKDERVKLLNSNINNFQRGEDIALQIRYFLNLVKTRETDRRNAIILRGYIYHHEDSCSQTDCCLRQYKNLMKQSISYKNHLAQTTNKHTFQGEKNRSNKSEMNKLLLQHARNMYRAAMRKFPTCTPLRIQYAFFLLQHMKRKQEAIAELTFANQFSPAFEEQFIIFRYLKMSEDFDDMGNEGGNAGGEEMDVVQKYAYESSLRQFQEGIIESARFHAQFWNQLKSDRPEMKQLNECGQNINKSVVLVEQHWDQLQKLNPNQPPVMKTYSKYLTQVLNDRQRGQELMARAKEATSGKTQFLEGEYGFESAEVQRNGQPCFVVSGNTDDLGIVVQCNQAASRVFGYTSREMLGYNVDKLMPSFIGKHHQKVLRKALITPPDHQTKDKFVYAQHKSGYVFPIYLQIKLIQSRSKDSGEGDEEQSGQFVGIIKIDKRLMSSNIAFLLVDKDRKIIGISSSCISMLYLDLNRLKKLNQQGITLDKFSSDIHLKKDIDKQYLINWNVELDFERQQSSMSKNSKSKQSHSSSDPMLKLKYSPNSPRNIKSKRIQLICRVDNINMNDVQGDIGHYVVRLDIPEAQDLSPVAGSQGTGKVELSKPTDALKGPKQIKKVPKYPDFHFKFDEANGMYLRDVRKSDENLNQVARNTQFVNWSQMRMRGTTLIGFDEYGTPGVKIEQLARMYSDTPSVTREEELKDEEQVQQASPNKILLEPGSKKPQQQPKSFKKQSTNKLPLFVDLDNSQRELLPHETGSMLSDKSSVQSFASSPKKRQITFFDQQAIMARKKTWGRDIQTYRLVEGIFKSQESNDEIKKMMEREEERKRQQEEMEENDEVLAFDQVSGGNLNSKKSLQMALKDKRPISSISRLKFVMNISMICLIVMASSDYSIISSNFADMNANFNLIQKSFNRISEFQRVSFDLRTKIMIDEGIQDAIDFSYISDQQNFTDFLLNDMAEALTKLYEYQSQLSLSPLSMSSGQHELFYEKAVKLYFRGQEGTTKELNFTINEAVLQLLSAVFTSKHLETFTEANDDLHFITFNLYNDLLFALRSTSEFYVEELIQRASDEVERIIVIFVISAVTIVLMLVVLFPVVRSVNSARLRILSLFIDIPYSIAINLSAKCEKFIKANADEGEMMQQEKTEVNTDDLEMEDEDDAGAQEEEGSAAAQGGAGQQQAKDGSNKPKKNKARVPIFEKAMNDNKFFFQFGFILLILMAYFIAMLVISLQYTKRIKLITEEMNLVAQSDSYFAFTYNVQREMIYDPDKLVLNHDSFEIARDSLETLYQYNELLQRMHFKNKGVLNPEYNQNFLDLYTSNLCTSNFTIKFDLVPFDCATYLPAQQGMQTVLTRYFELLKDSLKTYVNLKDNVGMGRTEIAQTLANSSPMRELYVLQFRFIGDSLRYLVDNLTSLTNAEFNDTIGTKTIAFVVFIICICFGYLVLWVPFVTKMTKDMWRSKSMLSIIPIEVILRMPRIHQFLLKQSFSNAKTKKQSDVDPKSPDKKDNKGRKRASGEDND